MKKKTEASNKQKPFASPLTSSFSHSSASAVESPVVTVKRRNISSPDDVDNGRNKNSNKGRKRSKKMEAKLLKQKAEDEEERHLTSFLFNSNSLDTVKVKEVDSKEETEYDTSHGSVFNLIDDSRDATVIEEERLHESDEISVAERETVTEGAIVDYNAFNGSLSEPETKHDELIKRKPQYPSAAWDDEDDRTLAISLQSRSDRVKKLRQNISEDVIDGKDYERRLRHRFQSTAGSTARTDWADVNALQTTAENSEGYLNEISLDDDTPSAIKLLSSSAPLTALQQYRIPPNIINVVRCPDANQCEPNLSAVQVAQFHPGSKEDTPILMTAGFDKTLRFFRVDAEGSEKIHGIHFPTLPIHSASFLGDTGKVVVSGRRPFFYIYDSVSGKLDKVPRILGRKEKSLEKFATSPDGTLIAFIGNDGYIILVEAKSKMWVADFKSSGNVRAVVFTPDSKCILASGSDGDVYRWDIRSRRCMSRFHNEDGSTTSVLSASLKFLAIGADSGVVNMYDDHNSTVTKQPKVVKSIMNLQTPIDCMKFNDDGQILAMSSFKEKDSVKLLHVPTQTVFSNWPTTKTPLGYVSTMDFSPGSKFLALGNDKGKCLLYKLGHYDKL